MIRCFVTQVKSRKIDDNNILVFQIFEAEDIETMRIEVENTGDIAPDSFAVQGSFDGSNWHDIDTTTFNGLAAGAKAQKLFQNLHFPQLRGFATDTVYVDPDVLSFTTNLLVAREDVI